MNRGLIILVCRISSRIFIETIDEAEYLLDQIPPPHKDEDPIATRMRERLSALLEELRKGAEGVARA